MKTAAQVLKSVAIAMVFVALIASIPDQAQAQEVRPKPEARKAFEQGVEAFNAGKYREAAEFFKQATTLDNKFGEAYGNCGASLANLKEYDAAATQFQKAIAASGIIESELKDLYAANVRMIFPWVVKTYFFWGKVLSELGKYTDAVDKYQKSERISMAKGMFMEPEKPHAEFYKRWAEALRKLGRVEEAREKLNMAGSSKKKPETKSTKSGK